jgi:hypothetical protein
LVNCQELQSSRRDGRDDKGRRTNPPSGYINARALVASLAQNKEMDLFSACELRDTIVGAQIDEPGKLFPELALIVFESRSVIREAH